MIKIENVETTGWEAAIRGMRNPMNSWDKSDSYFSPDGDPSLGASDVALMTKLASNGPVHAKYRRMITVYMDITAPLYWWKEFDTYKVGTVANSCSTMHKIHAKEFTLDDFSTEHLLTNPSLVVLDSVIGALNLARNLYLECEDPIYKKDWWWQMIQLLPSSYNQKRTVMLNYEVLHNMYHSRKNHKLDEWRDFCSLIEGLNYSSLITIKEN